MPVAPLARPQVYTLGASVTRGIGTTDRQYSYASRFFQYINSTFPHRRVGRASQDMPPSRLSGGRWLPQGRPLLGVPYRALHAPVSRAVCMTDL